MVGGGPTPQEVGDSLVRRGVHFLSAYGSSECCGPARSTPLLREPHEWYWMEFDPEMPIRFVKHDQGDGKDLYEFQMGVSCLASSTDARNVDIIIAGERTFSSGSYQHRDARWPSFQLRRPVRSSPNQTRALEDVGVFLLQSLSICEVV